jgi:probable HAF family extracellular repeat protein
MVGGRVPTTALRVFAAIGSFELGNDPDAQAGVPWNPLRDRQEVQVRRLALLGIAAVGLVAGAVVASASNPLAAPAESRWVPTNLGSLGQSGGAAKAINNRGQIVGYSGIKAIDPILGYHVGHAFLWQEGRMRDLGVAPPGYNAIYGLAINQRGQILGVSKRWEHPYLADTVVKSTAWLWEKGHVATICTAPGDLGNAAMNDEGEVIAGCSIGHQPRSYLWDNGRLTALGTLGGKETEASAINDRGQIVGWSKVASGAEHAFLWQDGRMTDLGTLGDYSTATAVNARGEVVGISTVSGSTQTHAVLWAQGRMIDLGIAASPPNIVVNDRGEVVWTGSAGPSTSEGAPHVFTWEHGKRRDLGTMGGRVMNLTAITERGQIVGNMERPGSYAASAFVWENGTVTSLDPVGNSVAIASNQRGQIVGGAVRGGIGNPTLWTFRP